MKKSRPTYLLLLGFLFFLGYHHGFANSRKHFQVNPAAQIIQKNNSFSLNASGQKESRIKCAFTSEFSDDDEFFSARKKIMTSEYAGPCTKSFTLLNIYDKKKEPGDCFTYLPCYKYIFQRTLRV